MKHLLLLFTFFSILISCQEEEINPEENKDIPDDKELSLEQQMNEFIEKEMKDVYLWADNVKDRNIDTDQEPSAFLKAMMYTELDSNWSYLETTKGVTKANSDGTEITFGYKIQFWEIGLPSLIGMIQYVYPNTPAAIAGLKRGDMIVMNNDELLYKNNYSKVVNDSRVLLQTGTISNGVLDVSEKKYRLSAQKVTLNPILLDTILEVGNKKVGYLVYSQFIDNESNSLSDLSEAIGKMKTESIDEFILDLRYNTGGRVSAAVRLASLLAPSDAVRKEDVLINTLRNKKYQNTSSSNFYYFDRFVLSDNLDLSKIYILTGDWTASASEVIISGLCPYITNTILIGEKTVGKYVGMSKTLPPKEELQKWTLWPVTFSYTNANGEDVKGGIEPRYPIKEYYNYLPPFGSLADPLLDKAIELISGQSPVASLQTRSHRATDSWKPLENDNKYLLIDN